MMKRLLLWKEEKHRKPLILKGVRQVGKTHLLKEFGRLHFSQCHYLNFEKQPTLSKIFELDLDPKRILTDLSFHLCGAGSLLGLHLSSGSFPVGKVTFETLRPMSFEEFLMATEDKSLPILQEVSSKKHLP